MSSGADTEPAVLVHRQGRIMVVTLNRPHARNAVNAELAGLLGEALSEADSDPSVWAMVVTGAGEQAFCAGADLKALAAGEPLLPPGHEEWGFAGYVAHPISTPTIAAVNGFALGGGTEIALASDLVVAADTASFGLPEVKRGLFAAAGGVFRLPTQLPKKVAMEMVLTGEPIDAARARELGLVNRVAAAGEVLGDAIALAERICGNAPIAVQAGKRLANGIVDGTVPAEEEAWARNTAELGGVLASEDFAVGTRAFARKETPQWTGR